MQVNLGHIHRMFHHPKHHSQIFFFRSEMPAHFLLFKNNKKNFKIAPLPPEISSKTSNFLFSTAIPIEQSRCLHLRHEKSIFGEEKSLKGVVYVLGTSRTKIANAA